MTAIDVADQPRFLFRRKDASGRVTERGLVFFPRYGGHYEDLAALARPENWGLDWVILRKYLDYTVHQLLREGKVVEAETNKGDAVMAFNTGLLTADTRPIFCFATRNHLAVDDPQPWHFTRWAVSSETVMRSFPNAPERARFWKDSPGELLFNPDWPVEMRLDHILGDNVDRFPRFLQQLPHLRKHALQGAMQDAIREVEADPHLAVPAYHFDTSSVSLLLPLRLIHSHVVDMALVVAPFGEKSYAAWTVLPLDWAYQNARLIKAPGAEWLGRARSSAAEQTEDLTESAVS